MEDKTTTEFEKVGTANANPVNISGAGSPNTIMRPRGGSKSGAPVGTTSHRIGTLERNGFQGAPVVNHVWPNVPEASSEGRNVRLMPSAKGNRDFYARRQFNQGV